MRPIVTEGLDPAECAGGVAYRRVTPFAAGQVLAVPRQSPTIHRDSCVAALERERACPPIHYEMM